MVQAITGMPVISTVSLFETDGERRGGRTKKLLWACSVALFIVFGSVVVNRYLVPLDFLWTTFEDRLIEMGIPISEPPVD